MAKIIDGKTISNELKEEVASRVQKIVEQGKRKPCLAVVLVGDDPASAVYVGHKEKACEKVGIESQTHRLSAEANQAEVTELVSKLGKDEKVDGILVQLPLPKGLDEKAVIEQIPFHKDVDGLGTHNQGLLALGQPGHRPCTPKGIMTMLSHSDIKTEGALAVVIGRSILVGNPVARLLTAAHATVIQIHSRSKDIEALCSKADILVAAAGQPKMIGPSYLKEGAVVIDVGIHRTESGLCGDVDFDAAKDKASWITPVPGGVGQMTIATLLSNCVDAYEMSES